VSAPLVVRGADEAYLGALAERLASAVRAGGAIQLHGDLGAGKTTFARALLRALGVGERVKSPTYSLVESYRVADLDIHHLDLYRIADAGELEWLGLPDLAVESALMVVEWPERGAGVLPAADLRLELRHAGAARDLLAEARSPRGEVVLAAWKAAVDAL
jgi:tRNA threonylcarbamoyladenosine biosynthesis protein TsaE